MGRPMRRLNRPHMEEITRSVHRLGGVIHRTAKNGLCVHDEPLGPGMAFTPSEGASESDADWLRALCDVLWPAGLPNCRRARPGGDADA